MIVSEFIPQIRIEKIRLNNLRGVSDGCVEFNCLKNGLGDTVLRVYHKWGGKAQAAGTVDTIPNEWLMTKKRVDHFFK